MNKMQLNIILFILILNFVFNTAEIGLKKDLSDVVLTTALGKIRGTYLTSQSGRNFYAFRGVRYAKPPIQELRFKPPEPVEHWSEIFDATKDGPICPQTMDTVMTNITSISEDCLRLNIYTHSLQNSDDSVKKSVLVYLHGGGLYSSSGHSKIQTGPQYLMDRDIVLVTLNYRLGTLGFLNTGTLEATGNAGLKDQVMALKWIKLHISKFGGDPGSITLVGHGAGAISISLHMVSPMSKSLFHKAILMSGAVTGQWKVPKHQMSLTKKQAELLNCDSESVNEIIKCFRTKNISEFVNSEKKLFEAGLENQFLLWKPVVEQDFGQERFLTEDPMKLYQNGKFMRIPIITGISDKEFVKPAVDVLVNDTLRTKFDNDFDEIAPKYFMYDKHSTNSKKITKTLRQFYLGSGSLHPQRSLDGLSQMFSDAYVGFAVYRFVNLVARFTKVYYYHFTYEGKYSNLYSPNDKPYGVIHGDELQYIFVNPIASKMFTEDDPEHRTVERLTRMIAAFANRGDPNKLNDEYLRSIRWRIFNYRKEVYLDIGDTIEMDSFLNKNRYSTWKELFPINWLNNRRGSEKL